MIQKIIKSSRTTEINACATRMIDAFNNSGLSSDNLLSQTFAAFKVKNDSLTQAINKTKIDSILEEKDANRDSDLRAFWFFLMGMVYNPTPMVANAAKSLFNIMERYSLSIIGESYDVESSLLKSLINDFESAELVPMFEAVPGAQELFDKLKTSCQIFEDARTQLDLDKAESKQQKTASEIKIEVAKTINNKIVTYLRAVASINPETYASFAEIINTIIENNNSNVNRR